jgi:hypothetical protein
LCEPAGHNVRIVCHSNWSIHVFIKLVFCSYRHKKKPYSNRAKRAVSSFHFRHLILQLIRSFDFQLKYCVSITIDFYNTNIKCIPFHYGTALFLPNRPITAPNSVCNIVLGAYQPFSQYTRCSSRSRLAPRLPAESSFIVRHT